MHRENHHQKLRGSWTLKSLPSHPGTSPPKQFSLFLNEQSPKFFWGLATRGKKKRVSNTLVKWCWVLRSYSNQQCISEQSLRSSSAFSDSGTHILLSHSSFVKQARPSSGITMQNMPSRFNNAVKSELCSEMNYSRPSYLFFQVPSTDMEIIANFLLFLTFLSQLILFITS